ncbi:MAG: PASTA domain-containing protein, partial [Erysipelotrichaceae bacterium]|nr:PASTA domain-containing protein [Erysipelotrichaceae bacterium]
PDLIDRIASLENVAFDENGSGIQYIREYDMPKLLSRKVDDVVDQLSEMDLEPVVIGDGRNVIGQYPEENAKVYSGHKVFILSDGKNITVPDFTGYSRKEVINYWNLSKLPIVMDGYGVAYSQSVAPGTLADQNTNITVNFRDINYTEPVPEPLEGEQENNE